MQMLVTDNDLYILDLEAKDIGNKQASAMVDHRQVPKNKLLEYLKNLICVAILSSFEVAKQSLIPRA